MKVAMKNVLLKSMMLLAALTGTTAWADDDVTIGDVSNTPCAYRTRADGVMGHQILKLTRFDGGLYGELNDFRVNCSFLWVKVLCQAEGQQLSINVDDCLGDGPFATCLCPINIYFTIFNALQDEYQLTVADEMIGTVSFKEHSVVFIDLDTHEQAYEEGFDYPVKVESFRTVEITDHLWSGQDLSQSLDIASYGDSQMYFEYSNYALPCEYTRLNAEVGLTQDSTLLVNILTDGIPGEGDCHRVADLMFSTINTPAGAYHLRLNHTILVQGEDGQERACSVCLYEGDISLERGEELSIPITDNNNYRELITAIRPASPLPQDSSAPYFDLQGRRLDSQPQKGVYIREGRKVVIH